MTVSVIMLTYNRESYVSNMITDILAQTYTDFEFIIVDNGSTDKSGAIADMYTDKDKRIRALHLSERRSIGSARNIGLGESKGRYIAYVDDDDRAMKGFLAFLVNLMEENHADISMCGASEGDGTTRKPQCLFDEKMLLTGEEALRLLLGRKYIRAGMPTKLYKREILAKYPFDENCKNEDIHTQYKYLLAGKKVAIHGVEQYYFTRHAGNVSGFTSNAALWDKNTMSDYLYAFHDRTEFVRQNAPDSYRYALYAEWSFMISMVDKIKRFHLGECAAIGDRLAGILEEHAAEFLNMSETQDFEKKWMAEYISAGR